MFCVSADVALDDDTFNPVTVLFEFNFRIAIVNCNQPYIAIIILDELAKPAFTFDADYHVGTTGAYLRGIDYKHTLLWKLRFHTVVEHLQRVEFYG